MSSKPFNVGLLQSQIEELHAAEEKLAEARHSLQEPVNQILVAAGLGRIDSSEKICSIWEYADGGLHIDTETWRDGYDTYSYSIPSCIIQSEDPLKAAAAYKQEQLDKAIARHRIAVEAEIKRLQQQL